MSAAHILVVDDETGIRELVKEILEDEHYVVSVAANGNEARQARKERRPDLILLDIWMPDVDGITLLKEWQQSDDEPAPPVVVMSGHGTVETAVEATRLGAYDFLEKPISMAKLLLTIRHALDDFSLRRENIGLKRHVQPLNRPLGKSPMMETLREQAERVALTDARVLLVGEPGVGKRLLAHLIHNLSNRKSGQFVEVGVATIVPANALMELFGSEDGDQVRYGLLEQANGGTLFFNEVADMDMDLQTRLASALQGQSFVRIGGSRAVEIDIRVIASTHQDLRELVRQGRFREDLYYQLNVVPIVIPPLRQHREDISELLTYYVDYFVESDSLPYRSFSVAAQNRLRNYDWPGNVRELRSIVHRLLILGSGETIEADEVVAVLGTQVSPVMAAGFDLDQPLRQAREQFERAYIEHQLRNANGNISQVAKAAGIERTHLYRKMKALAINPKES
jgi:two-component system nitrogen regulation response regulator NtrX